VSDMVWPIMILIVSIVLLMFYLRAKCEVVILRREFDDEFFKSLVNRMEFPFVRQVLEEFDVPVDYGRFRMQLKCDFLALTYLLETGGNTKRRFYKEERLLRMYFRVVFSLLWFLHRMGLSERAAVLKLTSILEYFANRAPRESWKAEIDVMVEDNGTVFLVYPLSGV
jgi:hypothetical protein